LALGGDGHNVHAGSVARIALLDNVSGKAPYLVRASARLTQIHLAPNTAVRKRSWPDWHHFWPEARHTGLAGRLTPALGACGRVAVE